MKVLFKTIIALLFLVCYPQSFFGQKKTVKTFTQNDFNAYEFNKDKYDLRAKEDFYLFREATDTASYFLDPSKYKGVLNYGVNFAARDKRLLNWIESYFIYYTDVVFEKCTFSASDSIAEIEGRIEGGWNTVDFSGKPPEDIIEISLGELKNQPFVFTFQNYNPARVIITYKGEEKLERFPLDTLNTLVFEKVDFKKKQPASTNFKVRFKVSKNAVLTIGKYGTFAHFYTIGEMMFAKQKKKGIPNPKKEKDAPRFLRIIDKNVQVNDPRNQIKKETPLYYQLTEKAEACILLNQFGKAKEQYALLEQNYPSLFARDMNNAARVAILSRDFTTALHWCERLAEKGVGLKYFNASVFNKLKQTQSWKAFVENYPKFEEKAKEKRNPEYIKKIYALLNEDQGDYGLENRKEPEVLYATTETVTRKLVALFEKEGLPTEEKMGMTMTKDTIINSSPDYYVLIRHAIQQQPKDLPALKDLLQISVDKMEFDYERSSINYMAYNSCYHIYKGNLYREGSCSTNKIAETKLAYKFKNRNGFFMDYGNFIISEYNKEAPEEWDKYYNDKFVLVMKLTDDWEFYDK